MAQGIYLLRQCRPVPRAAGAPRLAGPADAPIVAQLVADFTAEATPAERPADPAAVERAVATRLGSPPERAGFWLWEDGGAVVSLTGYGGPTPNGIRIGPVYTPPAHRGRGYATSLVAEQSAWLLSSGRRFCFLYTNLANPTSNGIYRRIGYEQVAEAAEIGFGPGDGPS
jgi:RimJ/RimL family protein N-acetyltransferase